LSSRDGKNRRKKPLFQSEFSFAIEDVQMGSPYAWDIPQGPDSEPVAPQKRKPKLWWRPELQN